jgi:hypothetical protein
MVRVTLDSNGAEVKRACVGQFPPMPSRPVPAVILASVFAAGCASTACVPATVVVERKEERRELRSEVRGIRTGPTGSVVEDRREVLVPEYWVLGRDARWYQLSAAEWQAAEPGRALSFCR